MIKRIAVCLASFALVGPVTALGGEDHHKKDPATGGSGWESKKRVKQQEGTGGSGAMDMEKAGPWTRKPTNERQIKREIQAFLREEDALMEKKDFQAGVERIDFPIYMATDSRKGEPHAEAWTRQ